MTPTNGITKEIAGYQTTIEQTGQCWRAQVDNVTICSCRTRRATILNAEFILKSQMAKHIVAGKDIPAHRPWKTPAN